MTLLPMKKIHEQTQPLPRDSLANAISTRDVISIYMVTVIVTPDATAYLYQVTTIFAMISYISHAYAIY